MESNNYQLQFTYTRVKERSIFTVHLFRALTLSQTQLVTKYYMFLEIDSLVLHPFVLYIQSKSG